MSCQLLKIRQYGCFELRDFRYKAGFTFPEHSHAECCFQLVLQGAFLERSRDVDGAYAAGSLIFRPAGFSHENPRFTLPTRSICVRLDPSEFPAHFNALAERRQTLLVHSPEALALGQRIAREMRDADDLTPLMLEAACVQALGLLTREARQPVESACAPLARRAEALARARFSSSIQVQDIARELGVTRYTLARAFYAQWGCHLGDYVQSLRLNEALRLLEETNRPIGEIAQETGFADQSHLTRLFKRRFGTTPRRLRHAE